MPSDCRIASDVGRQCLKTKELSALYYISENKKLVRAIASGTSFVKKLFLVIVKRKFVNQKKNGAERRDFKRVIVPDGLSRQRVRLGLCPDHLAFAMAFERELKARDGPPVPGPK